MKIPVAAGTPSKSKTGPAFKDIPQDTSVRVSPGKGGANLGTPKGCTSTRKAFQTGHGY